MAEEKKTETTKTNTTDKPEENILFPLTTEALNVISKIYSMSEEEWAGLSNRDREILQMPMLFLAQKMCTEFGYWTVDLIKYLAFLNNLDIKIDRGNWFIKIEEGQNEG